MYQAYSTQQKSISPTIALVRHVSSEKQITMNFPNGVNLNAIYVNQFTHEIAREGQISFKGPITIHLMASDIQNCYYLAWWSENRSRLICSCYSFRKNNELHCCHTNDDINQQPVEGAIRPFMEKRVEIETVAEYEDMQELKQRDIHAYWREISSKVNDAIKPLWMSTGETLKLCS